jgi:hypothetical protein
MCTVIGTTAGPRRASSGVMIINVRSTPGGSGMVARVPTGERHVRKLRWTPHSPHDSSCRYGPRVCGLSAKQGLLAWLKWPALPAVYRA